MKGKLPVVHMAHSVGTFFGMSGLATDVQGKYIGFIGDWGNGRYPIPFMLPPSEVQNKMIIMGHQILSCHVPVVRSFFILEKMLLSSLNLPYDHLPKYTNIIFHYPKK